MFLEFRKTYLLIFLVLCFSFLSYSIQNRKNTYKELSKKSINNQSINLNNLMKNLSKADKKLIPRLIRNDNGSSFYRYIKKPGEDQISLKEIEERILLGTDFYKKDREEIINLLIRINELNINNKLDHIDSGALGLWIPSQDIIIIDYRVIEMGSPTFLDVLSHEIIHVAQSCFSGSRLNFPIRLGLPLEYSTNINLNLSHNLYSEKSAEVMNLEREAFTYSKVNGAALRLLNNFCE